jgi:2'-5' RNA ligase
VTARVEGDERLRLFCALLLPPAAVDTVVAWQATELASSGKDVRIVVRENLHITLAFLGSTPAARVGEVVEALREACVDACQPVFADRRYRETRSVAMIELTDEGGRGARIAEQLFGALEGLDLYRREPRSWLPHVTVARFRSRPRLRPSLPDLGEVAPSDAAVMISRLRPGGAQYEVFESVSLGG